MSSKAPAPDRWSKLLFQALAGLVFGALFYGIMSLIERGSLAWDQERALQAVVTAVLWVALMRWLNVFKVRPADEPTSGRRNGFRD